jgi:signal transduction histidine kinase
MVVINKKQTIPRILLATGQMLWLEQVESYLVENGYHLHTASDQSAALDILQRTSVDAVIAPLTQESAAFFDQLRQRNTASLLLFLADDDVTLTAKDHWLNQADAVIPPGTVYLEQQLPMMLHLHMQNQHLMQRVVNLEADIDRQKRKTDEMAVLKNAIVRNVSHELRTPLLQVKSAVSLMGEDIEDKKLLSYAKNATARLETHVKNITMLGSSLDMRPGPIILRDAVEYARRNLRRVWEHRSQIDRIHLELAPNLPPILADKQGLSTVLQLLMDNAIKFSDDRIEVLAHQEDNVIQIAVRDYGIGIPDDQSQAIFDTFYQVDSSSTRRYGGAGVGLAIVKIILDNHNTIIHVDSTPDEGSTFRFALPVVDISTD